MKGERWVTLALCALLLAVGAFAWTLRLRPPLRVDGSPLASLPAELEGWQAHDIPLDETVESMLRADFNLQRGYRHPEQGLVWLYVGYYGTQRGGRPEHTPWICYGAQGWSTEAHRTVELDAALGLRANEMLVEQEDVRELVRFWYRSHRASGLLGGFDVVLDHTLGRLRGGRADGALVRISTRFSPGEEDAARRRLQSFGPVLERALAAHWPVESAVPRGVDAAETARNGQATVPGE